jgi:GTP-binding protein YchF
VHIDSVIDPKRDIEIVETELLLKDLETVERKLHEVDKHAKSGDKKAKIEYDFYHRLKDFIASGRLVHYFNTTHDDEKHFLRNLHLLTNKPVMYVCNIHERDIKNEISFVTQVREIAAKENAKVVIISAEVEAEIAELPEDERPAFLSELGLKESGLNQVIREGYDLLHLITFFTVAEKEVHARTVPKGTLAPQAAGTVHTDFEKGFIKAEIIKYKDIDRLGSDHAVKERGLFHIHGHDYVMEDGDIAFFRFNV